MQRYRQVVLALDSSTRIADQLHCEPAKVLTARTDPAPVYLYHPNGSVLDYARFGCSWEDGTFSLEKARESVWGERKCLIGAASVDMITFDASDASYSRPTSIRLSIEDDDWFWMAGIWRPSGLLGPQSFAILTQKSAGTNGPEVDRHPWLLHPNDCRKFLTSTGDESYSSYISVPFRMQFLTQ